MGLSPSPNYQLRYFGGVSRMCRGFCSMDRYAQVPRLQSVVSHGADAKFLLSQSLRKIGLLPYLT